ncbi:hypothetical protein ACG9X6_14215 [Acinetobacter guillouiae]|uniref:hypothetical protein n=1 Tax=Acinetobacter guillouiae TaxID=106649 RepID=UPI003AF9C488
MHTFNGVEAISALQSGKTVLCRHIGGLLDFDELNQFPATVFFTNDHEFCIKREYVTLADIQFTKPVQPHDLESGQEIFIVMPTCILRTKYDFEHGDICLSIANGFAQLDEENAKLQLQAFGKTFGNMISEIEIKDGFSEKPKKARNTKKLIQQESPQVIESKPAITIQTELQLYLDGLRACTNADEVESTLLNVDKVGFTSEQMLEITMSKESKLAEFSQPITIVSQENLTTSEDSLITDVSSPVLHPYQSVLDELLERLKIVKTPKEANALYKYTMHWTEEERKPVMDSIHKRLAEFNPPEKSQSSLMVRIQEAKTLIELTKLEDEIIQCEPAIHERLFSYANQRRTDLTMENDPPWEQSA